MIEARLPTTNGAIIDGNTTMSRRGTRGSWRMLGSGFDMFETVIRRFEWKNFPGAGGALREYARVPHPRTPSPFRGLRVIETQSRSLKVTTRHGATEERRSPC